MAMQRTASQIVEEQGTLSSYSSYRLLLRLGRARAIALVTVATVLASCAITALVLVFTVEPAEPLTLGGLWLWSMATAVVVPSLLCPLIVLVMMDMLGQLEAALQASHRMAQTDALTGLSNRRNFIDGAMRALEESRARKESLVLLMIDIDDFKRVNDTHGHIAGDHALVVVAGICGAAVRGGDLCARFGGEEFAVLLRDSGMPGALAIAESIRAGVQDAPSPAPRPDMVPLGVSIGCACSDETGYGLDALLVLADKRMYMAKRSGKNRVQSGGEG